MKHIFCNVLKRILDFCKRKTHSFRIDEDQVRLTKDVLRNDKARLSHSFESDANTRSSLNKSDDDISPKLESLSLTSDPKYDPLANHVRSNRILDLIHKSDYYLLTK
jgi:hypothetical protein